LSEISQDGLDDMVVCKDIIWLTGIGALALTGNEGRELFDRLVERGRAIEGVYNSSVEPAKHTLDSDQASAEEIWAGLEELFLVRIARSWREQVPTSEEISNLAEKAERATKICNELIANSNQSTVVHSANREPDRPRSIYEKIRDSFLRFQ